MSVSGTGKEKQMEDIQTFMSTRGQKMRCQVTDTKSYNTVHYLEQLSIKCLIFASRWIAFPPKTYILVISIIWWI